MRNRFLDAYLEAAFWTEQETAGNADLAPESLVQATRECAAFQDAAGDLLAALDDGQSGHDFWLTRNRHGAGFWDRGLGDVGDKLTDLAHAAGERDLYVGDDGLAYFSPGA